MEPSIRAEAAEGPKTSVSARDQVVGETGDERRLGADDREVDPFAFDERRDARDIVGRHGDATRHRRDPGVAGSGQELLDQRALRQPPREGVLAAAPADDEDPHPTGRLCSRAGPIDTTETGTPTNSSRRCT